MTKMRVIRNQPIPAELLTQDQLNAIQAFLNGARSQWCQFTDACAVAGVSMETMSRWKNKGTIRTTKIGRTTYYNRDDCEAYRKRREQRKVAKTTPTTR